MDVPALRFTTNLSLRRNLWALALLLVSQADLSVAAQAGALAPQQHPAHSAHLAGHKPQAARPVPAASNEAARLALLASAHAALLAGNTDAASAELDRAEGMSHSADTEVLQVLALMQRGQYQRAVAYAAHAAGAHLDVWQALALHAWLLAVGEQREHASSQVTAALRRHPDDPGLLALQSRLQTLQPLAQPAALPNVNPNANPKANPADLPVGPISTGTFVPANVVMVATGLLLDGSRTVLVPLRALQGATSIWVRSSLGAARAATIMRWVDSANVYANAIAGAGTGMALLTLTEPLTLPPQHPGLLRAPADAFAGSPGHVVGMLPSPEAAPAWPAMNTGFVGRITASGVQGLAIETARSLPGAPVFDRAGRWIGVVGASHGEASGNANRGKSLVPLTQLSSVLGDTLLAVPIAVNSANLTPADTYERALPLVLQVMVLRD